ncbi:MAG: putative NEK protein kinase [Streblomastix strix]|uniref:Putative NEK protein kinase n=1 Tax=Streblomastix strix TaxID=222440 RepID=A0A5J4VJY1_9EUKA|nr:MAG: putative NEK protein kinase [Streblomastix strix]
MAQTDELYEVIRDYPGQDGDPSFILVTKGEIVHVIKKEIEYYTIEKNNLIGKVPQDYLLPFNSEQSSGQDQENQKSVNSSKQDNKSLHSKSKFGNETEASDNLADSSVISVNTSVFSWNNMLFEIPKYEYFDIVKKLSGDAMGKTFLVQLKLTGKPYVMKRVDYLEDKDKKRADLEVTIMQKLSSRYTVRLIWAFEDREELFMITDYCELGDLRKVIKELKLLSEEERINHVWALFAQIIKAVDIMHSLGIIHRDIKPANIFIMEDGTARLGDFGLAKDISVEGFAAVAGTLNYQAAEVWTMRRMTFSSDLFAVGVCIYELITGENPFAAQSQQEMIEKIKKGDFKALPSWVPIELRQLIAAMLNPV